MVLGISSPSPPGSVRRPAEHAYVASGTAAGRAAHAGAALEGWDQLWSTRTRLHTVAAWIKKCAEGTWHRTQKIWCQRRVALARVEVQVWACCYKNKGRDVKNASQPTAPSVPFSVFCSQAPSYSDDITRFPAAWRLLLLRHITWWKPLMIPQAQQESQNNCSESGHFLNLGPVVCLSERSFSVFPCK